MNIYLTPRRYDITLYERDNLNARVAFELSESVTQCSLKFFANKNHVGETPLLGLSFADFEVMLLEPFTLTPRDLTQLEKTILKLTPSGYCVYEFSVGTQTFYTGKFIQTREANGCMDVTLKTNRTKLVLSEVEGTTNAGEQFLDKPVVVGGIDPNGNVVALRVDEQGRLIISGVQTGDTVQWFSGFDGPADTLGANGDYYLQLTNPGAEDNGNVFSKNNNLWTLSGNLAGTNGVDGAPGAVQQGAGQGVFALNESYTQLKNLAKVSLITAQPKICFIPFYKPQSATAVSVTFALLDSNTITPFSLYDSSNGHPNARQISNSLSNDRPGLQALTLATPSSEGLYYFAYLQNPFAHYVAHKNVLHVSQGDRLDGYRNANVYKTLQSYEQVYAQTFYNNFSFPSNVNEASALVEPIGKLSFDTEFSEAILEIYLQFL